jgi:hypothetical protein
MASTREGQVSVRHTDDFIQGWFMRRGWKADWVNGVKGPFRTSEHLSKDGKTWVPMRELRRIYNRLRALERKQKDEK